MEPQQIVVTAEADTPEEARVAILDAFADLPSFEVLSIDELREDHPIPTPVRSSLH